MYVCMYVLAGLITLVLLMGKWMGLFLRKNPLLRCWGTIQGKSRFTVADDDHYDDDELFLLCG